MTITAIYAALLGLLLVLLSLRVIGFRRRNHISLGHAGSDSLERRVRAHGNLAEYAPIALILMGLLETKSVSPLLLHGLGASLVAGRLLHGWALSFSRGNAFARVVGMALTLGVIITAAVVLLIGSQLGG